MSKQLELFPNDPMNYLWTQIQKTQDSLDHTRKGLFMRYDELMRMMIEIQEQLDESKRRI